MSDFKFHTPNSWILSSLPDIAGINMGQSPSSSDVNEQSEGIVFFQGKAEFGKLYPTPRKYCTKPTKIASAGDILLSIRAPVGPTNIATETTAIGRGLAAISAHSGLTDPKYLLYYFRCIEPWLSTQGTGSTFKAISGQFIKELKAPLPSFAEQKIIAEKLDILLAQVDSTKARLEQIPQILKRFRQAVLSAAVSGALTNAWRKNKEYQYDSLELGTLAKFIDYRGKTPTKTDSGIPLITAKNIRQGYISKEPREYIAEADYEKWMTRGIPSVGDVLITTEAPMGYIANINIEGKFALAQRAICLQFKDPINSFFASIYMQSSIFQQQLNENATGSTVKGIKASLLKKIKITFPPLSEQHEIVRRVEQLFAYADTIEKQVNNALARVNNLTQSILAKAFRGELTAQWRAENPDLISGENSAAALLEKIKAERAASGGKKAAHKQA
ncbi:TPA: restriction endonuclease subunit S [Klebsiella pneumoniae]|uniref:restriction endonuclease subunit S n=1 Tax=Klebsiella pneumoniae TaxID=573 RepID=UPI000E2A7BB0|nr:restriction endonuclease subunit S [Klebsiella pneumoniae]HDS2598512.1 restriction endonuclease subunit S [Klebsiella pneumoniae subsp. pneumoniae]MDG3469208.1 restriction endonuclease subunit S [Klebsiella pneumoniae]MDS0188047.1 restriction endonuclease subunit S [Klebsiella pneumoniae]MDS1048929.1 restriction endonuclease subunit S [Klebsiella pneumoniae]MEE2303162.1 restriction endonuclease subunit S [Klebsiella pneumoniae]